MVKPSLKRKVAGYLLDRYQSTVRQVCKTIKLTPSTYYRKSVRDDSEVEEKLRALAEKYPTRGVDWYYLKIRGEGLQWNRKRILRIYRKLNLGLRRKHKKRINRPYREGLAQPILPNVCWSMDFMSDALEDGRRIRILNIMDDYNREALAVECGISYPSERVIRTIERIKEDKGLPLKIRVDNGPEFTSVIFADYCRKNKIEILYIQPGKPNQNGFIERFNRTYREDVLDAYLFERLEQVQIISEKWRVSYNEGHPHQSLNGLSPIAFKYARHKVIDAFEQVKAKMNGDLPSPALTRSTPSIEECLRDIQKDFSI